MSLTRDPLLTLARCPWAYSDARESGVSGGEAVEKAADVGAMLYKTPAPSARLLISWLLVALLCTLPGLCQDGKRPGSLGVRGVGGASEPVETGGPLMLGAP